MSILGDVRELTGKEVIELLRHKKEVYGAAGAMVQVGLLRLAAPVYDDNGEEYEDDVYLPLDYRIDEDGVDVMFGMYESGAGGGCAVGLYEEDIKGEIAYNSEGKLDLWIDLA